MATIDEEQSIVAGAVTAPGPRTQRLRYLRYAAVTIWAAVVLWRTITDGFAFNRELVLLYISTGLIAASIGQGRRMFYVIRDWLPFAVLLIAYDLGTGRPKPPGGCSPAPCRRSGCRNV